MDKIVPRFTSRPLLVLSVAMAVLLALVYWCYNEVKQTQTNQQLAIIKGRNRDIRLLGEEINRFIWHKKRLPDRYERGLIVRTIGWSRMRDESDATEDVVAVRWVENAKLEGDLEKRAVVAVVGRRISLPELAHLILTDGSVCWVQLKRDWRSIDWTETYFTKEGMVVRGAGTYSEWIALHPVLEDPTARNVEEDGHIAEIHRPKYETDADGFIIKISR